jgi:glycerophosphoryl diester phosphodiesterase
MRKSYISKQPIDNQGTKVNDYASSFTYSGVNSGFLPTGFVAIDIAHDLGLNLYDPDTKTADSQNYAPVDATQGQRPRSGNGLIGGSGQILDQPDAKVVVAANGGSDLIYVPDRDVETVKKVVDFLAKQDYTSGLFVDDDFGAIPGTLSLSSINLKGSTSLPKPSIVLNFKTFATDTNNPFQSQVEIADTGLQEGQGMHGSFGRGDTYNTMMAIGPDFKSGYTDFAPVSNTDVATTLANIVGFDIPKNGDLVGRVISEALKTGPDNMASTRGILQSEPNADGVITYLNYQTVGDTKYFDAAGFAGRTVGLATTPYSDGFTQLVGRAVLPADTFAEGLTSGQFLNLNNDGTVSNNTNFNGRIFPFTAPDGQPVQGFSAVIPGPKTGTYLVMVDNGYGTKANSPDSLLRFYGVEPDFKTGQVYPVSINTGERLDSFNEESLFQLNDKNGLLKGFQQIVADQDIYPGSSAIQANGIQVDPTIKENRLLTGADFDLESFRRTPDGTYWFGEEFGPFLLHTDANGTLLSTPISTPNSLPLNTLSGQQPIIIGHRGASGLRPEHTLASYELAIDLGADYIEPDLVSTKDGILIARHENNITDTTDVANRPEFSDRKTTKSIDGQEVTGWFTEDFTLAEIKTLRAKERLPLRDQSFNGQFEVPTFEEVIALAKRKTAETGRTIGIYPETKHPTYFSNPTYVSTVTPGPASLALEEPLVDILNANGYQGKNAPVYIQSFEVGNLQKLHTMTDVPLIQLLDAADIALDGTLIENKPYDFVVSGDTRTYGDLRSPAGLASIATYASGIGPWKRMIVSVKGTDANGDGQADDVNGDGTVDDADKILTAPTSLIPDAHTAGLLVHPYTFRNESRYLAADYKGDPAKEIEQYIELGIDGYFTDFAGTGKQARDYVTQPFVRSPDNPAFANLSEADKIKSANLPRSKGFEGMALTPDGSKLYTLLEGPLTTDTNQNRLLINEFDVNNQKFTGKTLAYRLDEAYPNRAIGDMTAINDHEFLVIERDNGQGDASNPAFTNPAKSKKVYKVDFNKVDANGFVEKELVADLLNISDPLDKGGSDTRNGVFTFPFVTIEDVLPIDNQTLLIINDNNYPFSAGRTPGQSDNDEFIKIRLSKPLDLG